MQFDPILESAYRDAQFRSSLRYLRTNLAILIGLVFAIVQVDQVVIPGLGESVPSLTRAGVMISTLIIAMLLSFTDRAAIWYPRVMAVLMAAALMGIAWIGLVSWSLGEDRVFARLLIATMAVYFIVGLRFRPALLVNLVGLAFYCYAAYVLWEMPPYALTQSMAMFLMTSVICAAGAYNLEHARRTAWLEGQLLQESAGRDGLTGILNRRRLDEHLPQIWHQGLREQKPIALLFADIDCFKAYNDHYGHQAGDEALKAVASVLARFSRRPLDIAARFGGEEFALALFDTSPADAMRIADRIMNEVSGLGVAHARSPVAPVLTISIGVACLVPSASQNYVALLQLADQALYAAKAGGRNKAHIFESNPGSPQPVPAPGTLRPPVAI
jgi:diguanylate cyclase (GGDEF)-like protein